MLSLFWGWQRSSPASPEHPQTWEVPTRGRGCRRRDGEEALPLGSRAAFGGAGPGCHLHLARVCIRVPLPCWHGWGMPPPSSLSPSLPRPRRQTLLSESLRPGGSRGGVGADFAGGSGQRGLPCGRQWRAAQGAKAVAGCATEVLGPFSVATG